MAESFHFNKKQRFWVGEALEIAETLAGDFFRVDLRDLERFPYDLQTLAYLKDPEKTQQGLAQICKYEYRRRSPELGGKEFYRICLQDDRILQTVERDHPLLLRPLLLYVITHELVHIFRFSLEPQRFYLDPMEKRTEERYVHRMTYEILRSFSDPSIEPLLERYRPWWGRGKSDAKVPNLDNFR